MGETHLPGERLPNPVIQRVNGSAIKDDRRGHTEGPPHRGRVPLPHQLSKAGLLTGRAVEVANSGWARTTARPDSGATRKPRRANSAASVVLPVPGPPVSANHCVPDKRTAPSPK